MSVCTYTQQQHTHSCTCTQLTRTGSYTNLSVDNGLDWVSLSRKCWAKGRKTDPATVQILLVFHEGHLGLRKNGHVEMQGKKHTNHKHAYLLLNHQKAANHCGHKREIPPRRIKYTHYLLPLHQWSSFNICTQ